MSLLYLSEGIIRPKLPYRKISIWLKSICYLNGRKSGDLTYIFCGDKYLHDINNRFLSHDYFTDIVTFDYSEKDYIAGDMFISIDRVKDNSILFETLYKDELLRVMAQGLLHLLGYQDNSEVAKDNMRKLENEYISMYIESENEDTK